MTTTEPVTRRFDDIAAHGNAGRKGNENQITCADGFTLSVIAGLYTYCSPRPGGFSGEVSDNYPGPYDEVEVGFPSERPEPWHGEGYRDNRRDGYYWRSYAESPDEPTETVYGYVPVQMVRDLILSHGGEQS